MNAERILGALRQRGATFEITDEGRLLIDLPEGREMNDAEIGLVRQHKATLIDLIFRETGSEIDADYDVNERAAIQAEGCSSVAADPKPDRPKLVQTAAEILARTFDFDEVQARCESAYRRGVHQALGLATEIVEQSESHDIAIDWLGRVEAVASDLRFKRKGDGRGMLLETIREESSWRRATSA